MKKLDNLFIKIINFYQNNISIFLKKNGIECKYYPTCSEYTKQAIKKYGFLKGFIKGFKRFLKCNPFSKGGYDPLK